MPCGRVAVGSTTQSRLLVVAPGEGPARSRGTQGPSTPKHKSQHSHTWPQGSRATVTPTEEVTTKDSGTDASFILFQPGLRGRALLCPLTAPTPGSPHSHPSPGRWGVNLHPCEWCPLAGDLISRQRFNPTFSDRNTTQDATSWR